MWYNENERLISLSNVFVRSVPNLAEQPPLEFLISRIGQLVNVGPVQELHDAKGTLIKVGDDGEPQEERKLLYLAEVAIRRRSRTATLLFNYGDRWPAPRDSATR